MKKQINDKTLYVLGALAAILLIGENPLPFILLGIFGLVAWKLKLNHEEVRKNETRN